MKIAIDVRSLMEGKPSGVAEYTTQIVRSLGELAENEHELQLFYNSWRSVELAHHLHGSSSIKKAFRYPNKLFNTSQLLLRQPRWDVLIEADVFFVPNVRLMPLQPATPFIVTAHDLSFERFPEFYSARRRAWHMLMRPRSLMRSADAVIAVSEATKRDVVELYEVPEDRVRVIHSGVTEPVPGALGPSAEEQVRRRYSLEKPYVLFVGTLEPRKNVVSIVEAFEAIADLTEHDLVLAGADGWLTAELDRAIATSSARGRIHRLGHVDEIEKWALYGAADLFVYPSFYEGFGFPPLEALLAGTPVITSHNSSLPEVVGEWADLINPYDPAELALVMQEVLRDPPAVTEQTKQTIRQKFSWRNAAEKTLRMLEEVA